MTPPPAARKIRELVYNTFMLEDHALHVFVLGGPDFIVGPTAPPSQRTIIGVIGGIGLGLGYIAPVSTLVKWFPDRRGLAAGEVGPVSPLGPVDTIV